MSTFSNRAINLGRFETAAYVGLFKPCNKPWKVWKGRICWPFQTVQTFESLKRPPNVGLFKPCKPWKVWKGRLIYKKTTRKPMINGKLEAILSWSRLLTKKVEDLVRLIMQSTCTLTIPGAWNNNTNRVLWIQRIQKTREVYPRSLQDGNTSIFLHTNKLDKVRWDTIQTF